jgi:hypothetical protein
MCCIVQVGYFEPTEQANIEAMNLQPSAEEQLEAEDAEAEEVELWEEIYDHAYAKKDAL